MHIEHELMEGGVELPDIIDVLVHLPNSRELRREGVVVAHAIQYNVSATATAIEEALSKLAGLIAQHCQVALSLQIHPINMAQEHYMKAFFLGVPVPTSSLGENINARLSAELASRLRICGGAEAAVDVRDLRGLQQKFESAHKLEVLSIEELVEAAI